VTRRYARGSKPKWHIAVLSPDGQRLVFSAQCEDLKEIQALATEARSQGSYQIHIRQPGSQESYSWD